MNYEQLICGLIIHEHTKYAYCVDAGVCSSSFKDPNYRRIWVAIAEVCDKDTATKDLLVENVSMKCMDIIKYVTGILGSMHRELSIEAAVRGLFVEQRKARLCLELSRAMSEVSSTSDPEKVEGFVSTLKESLEKQSVSLNDRYSNKEYKDVILDITDALEENVLNYLNGKQVQISTGYKRLDKSLTGFLPGGFYILAARTGMGKTTLAINFADNVLKQGHGVLFFSNEMSARQIGFKHLSMVAKVRSLGMQDGSINNDDMNRIHAAINSNFNANFIINEFAGTQFEKFKHQLRSAVKKYKVKVVFHDYIQQMFMEGQHSSRVQELSRISSDIKTLARELKISIVCLAQLNRQAEMTANSSEPPNIGHIKDSGAMEQDADVVMIIHRKRDSEDEGTEIIVAKNRFNYVTGGNNGHIILKTNLAVNSFYEDLKNGK